MSNVTALAAALIEARKAGRPRPLDSLPIVTTVEDALAVQAAVTTAVAPDVPAYKIALRADGTVVPGAMYRHLVKPSGGTWRWEANHASSVEVEIAFRLKSDLPVRAKAYATEEVADAVATAVVGIEMVQSRIVAPTKLSFEMGLADNINNGGYIVGSEVADWRGIDLSALRCTLKRDGAVIYDAVGGHVHKDPIIPLVAYANRQHGAFPLKVGQVVTTGTLCGAIAIGGPCLFEASIEKLGDARLVVTG